MQIEATKSLHEYFFYFASKHFSKVSGRTSLKLYLNCLFTVQTNQIESDVLLVVNRDFSENAYDSFHRSAHIEPLAFFNCNRRYDN